MNSEILFGVHDADGDLVTLVGAPEEVRDAMRFFGIRNAKVTKSRFEYTINDRGERCYVEIVDLDSYNVG